MGSGRFASAFVALVVGCIVFAAHRAPAATYPPFAFVSTDGRAQADAWYATDTRTDGGQAIISRRGETNPDDNPVPDNYAEASARATAMGTLGARGSLGGAVDRAGPSPFDPKALQFDANAEYFVPFVVRSDTLADGTPVTVNLNANFHGSLTLHNPDGAPLPAEDFTAFFYTIIQITTMSGTSPGIVYEGDGGFYEDGVFVDDYMWKDRFTVTTGGGTVTAALDVNDTVSFQLEVGHEYEFVPSISATAFLRTPRNVTAIVDFYDTATLALNPADAGVRIVVIPEPAAAGVLFLVAPWALSRRRRIDGVIP